jgi:hypothetical protein
MSAVTESKSLFGVGLVLQTANGLRVVSSCVSASSSTEAMQASAKRAGGDAPNAKALLGQAMPVAAIGTNAFRRPAVYRRS